MLIREAYSTAKGATICFLFLPYALALIAVAFLYGIALFAGIFLLVSMVMTVLFAIESLVVKVDAHSIDGIQDLALFAAIILLLVSLIMAGLVAGYYIIVPLSLRRKLRRLAESVHWDDEVSVVRMNVYEKVHRLSKKAAASLGVRDFNAKFITRSSNIATLKIGRWTVLFFNPILNHLLNDTEIEAIIAHELGHLHSKNVGFSYSFMRRSILVSKFLDNESNPVSSYFFRRFVNAVTWIIVVKSYRDMYRWAYFKILRLVSTGVRFYVMRCGSVFKQDFHAAEFQADAYASEHYRAPLIMALLKLVNFAVMRNKPSLYETSPAAFRGRLLQVFHTESLTHPSPRQRIDRLQREEATVVDCDLVLAELTSEIAILFSEAAMERYQSEGWNSPRWDVAGEAFFLSMAISNIPDPAD